MALCRKLIFSNLSNLIKTSSFGTSSVHCGKRTVRKFPLFAFRWTNDFKERQKTNPDPHIKVYKYGVREPGFKLHGKTYEVPETIPELIVPDLKDCPLKPYVSYKTADVVQSEFTARDLFDAVYSRKIEDDYKANKLNDDGSPKEPSEAEQLKPEEAKKRARMSGSDMFG